MRSLIYYVACSVDGLIAPHDGSHDGFSQDPAYYADLFAAFPETVPAHLREKTFSKRPSPSPIRKTTTTVLCRFSTMWHSSRFYWQLPSVWRQATPCLTGRVLIAYTS